MRNKTSKLLLLLMILSLNACSEYWWTRGQPPSTKDLFFRANERIEEALSERANDRPEIAGNALEIKKVLSALEREDINIEELRQTVANMEIPLKNLESKVSYGNRPPLSELTGQLRAIKNDLTSASEVDGMKYSAIRLFGGRVLMYLSSELKVPAPDKIA